MAVKEALSSKFFPKPCHLTHLCTWLITPFSPLASSSLKQSVKCLFKHLYLSTENFVVIGLDENMPNIFMPKISAKQNHLMDLFIFVATV